MALTPVTWWEARPALLRRELAAMTEAAPDLEWRSEHGLWHGHAPLWPFARSEPAGLAEFVGGRRLELALAPCEAHPGAAPRLWPINPEPELSERTQHRWHVNGDGSLCMFQRAVDWTGEELCAALVPKASGWFLEYLLMKAGRIDSMTERGVVEDGHLDDLMRGDTGVTS